MSPQQSIAHYRIVSKLGEGGMGAVYRATDTRLNRDVALKVLPDSFANDPERMTRFEREAQVLASLNHPNIATIYGVESRAIVLELVEGPTLAGPLSEEQVLPLLYQLIEALEYAHDKGIVHRDLKPANLKLSSDGRTKVLDFGLAKAIASESAEAKSTSSPTLTMHATMAGTIMGTAAYMSPEQARGQNVDKRTDIWAFGAVVYELLTGKPLFEGPTVTDTLAAVLQREIDLMPVPARFRPLLRACLERDPRRRMRDIGDSRLLLEEVPAPAQPPPARPPHWPVLAAMCALAALTAGIGWWRAALPVDRPLLNMSVDLGPEAVAGQRDSFALSPDGTKLLYHERAGEGPAFLAVRDLAQSKGAVLSRTAGAVQPFFSPDGQWIAFFADGKLKKMPLAGGAPISLCPAANPKGGSWREDGRIVFAPVNGELFLVGENGGTPQQVSKRDPGELSHRWPQWLPGGDAVLFSANVETTNWDSAAIAVLSLKTGRHKTLFHGGYYARYLPGGYLVYVREGNLFGVRFNLSRLETVGQPVVLLESLASAQESGGGQFDFARNGALVYLAGKTLLTGRYPFGWMAAGGKLEPIRGAPPDSYSELHLTTDGKRAAFMLPDGVIALWDFERGALTRLPAVGTNPANLVLMPDGRHMIYGTRGDDHAILWRRLDGSGEAVTLLRSPGIPLSISPDGRWLATRWQGPASLVPIDAHDPDHPKAGLPEQLQSQESTGTEITSIFSPDGRWVAYVSGQLGTVDVYVRPFRGSGNGRFRWAAAVRRAGRVRARSCSI
jgi:serine/threonine-protein kinase